MLWTLVDLYAAIVPEQIPTFHILLTSEFLIFKNHKKEFKLYITKRRKYQKDTMSCAIFKSPFCNLKIYHLCENGGQVLTYWEK